MLQQLAVSPNFPDWVVKDESSLYRLTNYNVTFEEAQRECVTHGGDLVVPQNLKDVQFITGLFDSSHMLFLGINDLEKEGEVVASQLNP